MEQQTKAGVDQQTNIADEMKAMEWEPLRPVELTLIRWSLGIGVGSIFILYWLSQTLFPAGH